LDLFEFVWAYLSLIGPPRSKYWRRSF